MKIPNTILFLITNKLGLRDAKGLDEADTSIHPAPEIELRAPTICTFGNSYTWNASLEPPS